MPSADVIVVGAGPAGATAAKVAAEAGSGSVLLLDKAQFPRPKTCAGGLVSHTFQTFPYVQPFIENYNHAVAVYAPRLDASFAISSEEPLLAMTKGRQDFDAQLLAVAQKAGVEFHGGIKVVRVRVESHGVEVQCEDGATYLGKVVIGADSVASIVAKGTGTFRRYTSSEMGIAMEQEFPLSGADRSFFGKAMRVSFFLHYGHLPGYGWVFPRATSVNVGIGTSSDRGPQLRAVLSNLMADLQKRELIPAHLELTRPKAALLPSTLPSAAGFGTRVLLAGDAANFCSPITGEGIYYAMTSGAIAGRVAAQAVGANDCSARFLSQYDSAWRGSVGKELEFQYFAKRTVLASERRCGKAVEWGAADPKLRDLFVKFFLGSLDMKGVKRKMVLQYARCKVKEKLGRLKTNYTKQEFGK